MANEIIFIFHIGIVGLFTFAALRLGREALMTWVALQGVLANLFVLKQMSLFNLSVTCSDVYAVGCFLSLNLLQEYFDKASAKKAIGIAAVSQAFFMVMSQFHLAYTPSSSDYTHDAFNTILTAYPRILMASLSVFYLVQNLDVQIFQMLKKMFPQGSFAKRNAIGMICSQLLDTVLFSFLGLYGLVSSILDVIMISFSVKLILVILSTPMTLLVKSFKPAASNQ